MTHQTFTPEEIEYYSTKIANSIINQFKEDLYEALFI